MLYKHIAGKTPTIIWVIIAALSIQGLGFWGLGFKSKHPKPGTCKVLVLKSFGVLEFRVEGSGF